MNSPICIVIPCYNEEERLPKEVYENYFKSREQIHFLFVNDGSKDNTISILKNWAESFSQVDCLDLKENGGKAEAVRQGFLKAKDQEFSYIGFWDADLATPLSEIELYENIASINKFDCIMGSRIQRLGSNIERNWYRHILGRVFATAASIALSLPVYDTQCGAKLYKSSLSEELFSKKFITYWLFDVEILFRLKKTSSYNVKNIYELPLRFWKDEKGSKLKIWDFLKAPIELLRMYFHYR